VQQDERVALRTAGTERGSGAVADPEELAGQLSSLARALHQEGDPQLMLHGIVQAAVQLIPGCEQASISAVAGRRHVTSRAPSGELARTVDALQEEVGQGPCLDAVFEDETVRVPDMAGERRWPQFASRASAAGVGSMLAFQLYVDGDSLGALNLYSRESGAFDSESEHVGLLFASHAALAYAAAQQHTALTRTVATRQVIGQAQGILMERHKVTADQAFALLVGASQHSNVKLRDLADRLVHSGVLPHVR
jgi:transcriptional regulator with GAF, ATPase, and Fis domain